MVTCSLSRASTSFDDPEDKASDIYKTSAIKREDRITSILGKHFKENPDTARQSLSNAYYEVCSTIKPDIVRALQESGKVSRNVGSLITYLDAKHIRKDNYTLAALYESYFFLTLHEGDDIETHIELLNHAATLLHNAGVPNFMDERIRSLHLIKQLPISWKPWRETYLAAAAITTVKIFRSHNYIRAHTFPCVRITPHFRRAQRTDFVLRPLPHGICTCSYTKLYSTNPVSLRILLIGYGPTVIKYTHTSVNTSTNTPSRDLSSCHT